MKKKATENKQKQEIQKRAVLPMTATGFQPVDMESAYRQAEWMAKSSMMSPGYRGNPANCLFLLDMAMGLGIRWQFLMQRMYMVKDVPALDAQLTIGLVNRSGLFTDPLDYEVVGDDPQDSTYKVRAYARRASTDKVLYGPWITWKLVKAEGWGSKWKSMPEQMFHYRAASWFANRHCPEVKMGMMTTDEATEVPHRKHIDSVTFDEAQQEAAEEAEARTGSVPVDTEMGETDTEPTEKPADDEEFMEGADDLDTKAKADLAAAEAEDTEEGGRWHCKACGHNFPMPSTFGRGKKQHAGCVKCYSANIEDTGAFHEATEPE